MLGRRLLRGVGIGRPAARLDEAPVDQPSEPDEFVIEVNNLVEPGAKKIALSGLPLVPWPQEKPSANARGK